MTQLSWTRILSSTKPKQRKMERRTDRYVLSSPPPPPNIYLYLSSFSPFFMGFFGSTKFSRRKFPDTQNLLSLSLSPFNSLPFLLPFASFSVCPFRFLSLIFISCFELGIGILSMIFRVVQRIGISRIPL